MSNFRKAAYIKMVTILTALAVILTLLGYGHIARADGVEGISGSEVSSAISSSSEVSEETSSEEVSSEIEEPQVFGALGGASSYNMSSGPLEINATDGDVTISGTYYGAAAGITVKYGYKGKITFDNVSIKTNGSFPAMILDNTGAVGINNTTPGTQVELILIGINTLHSGANAGAQYIGYSGLDTGMGTQVTISGTGTLNALSSNVGDAFGGGAGIGGGGTDGMGGFPSSLLRNNNPGGNVIIKSGTINAQGGYHAAGIGGGCRVNETNVVIIGGNVTSIGGVHSYGIGGGCLYIKTPSGDPGNTGYLAVLIPNTSVGSISASGGQGTVGDVGGTSIYIGDPTSPNNLVKTVDNKTNADIYADFSPLPDLVKGLTQAKLSPAQIAKYPLGTTDGSGNYYLHAQIAIPLTFFTDATATDGMKYLSQSKNLPGPTPTTVVLPKASTGVTAVLTTGGPTDLFCGSTPTTSQEQIFTITNTGIMNVKNLGITLTGTDASKFTISAASATSLSPGGTTVVKIMPISGLAVGTYNVSIQVTGDCEDVSFPGVTVTTITGLSVAADPQIVKKKSGVGGTDGKVEVTNLDPAISWVNENQLNLKASTQIAGDTIETWRYIVTTSPSAPAATDPAWKTIAAPTSPAISIDTDVHNFPAGTDDTYYVHWTIETAYATGMNGTITKVSTSTYNIDLVPPTVQVTSIATSVGTLPVLITITFSEPVDVIAASNLVVTNGVVTGAVTPVGTPVNGQYTIFTATIQPNAGLTTGDNLTVEVPANITKDRATNPNSGSGSTGTLSLSVNTTSPTATYSYADQQVFVTQPGGTDIVVTLYANGTANQNLYEAGTTTLLSSASATQFISVNGTLIDNVTYSATMTKVGNNYVYTITAGAGFLDGPFVVSISPNKVENHEGNLLQPTSQTFNVYIPVITGITANPPTMGFAGGPATVTVTGKYLNYGIVEVNSSIDGTTQLANVKSDGLSGDISILVPANNDYQNDKVYTFYPLLNGTANTSTCTITVDRKTAVVNYDSNGGNPATQSNPSVYNTLIPAPTVTPTKLASALVGWTKDPTNVNPSTAVLVNFGTDLHDVNGDMTLYAVWKRTDWIITFDINGGDATSLPTSILVPVTNPATEEGTANLDVYLPGGAGEPYYNGYSYLGLTESVDGGTAVPMGNFQLKKDLLVVANWTKTSVKPVPNPNPTPTPSSTPGSLPYTIPPVEPGTSSGTGKDTVNPGYADSIGDPVYGTYSNIAGSGVYVTYKEESTVGEVEGNLLANATYTDIYGTVHTLEVHTTWNTGVLHDGGVELIEFYTVDKRGAQIVSADCYGTVFVLNRPYLQANDVHYIFEGEGVTGDEYNPYAYAEVPILSQGRIARIKLPTVFDLMGADTQTAGSYGVGFNATFTDAFGQTFNLHKASVLVVRTKAKPTKEDEAQANSSEFWVKVTEIYHLMKPGQVIEINDLNFKDGGRLLDEEIPADAGYDRLIKVTPNPYVYMNPCILDRIRVDKEGEMQVFLGGRTLTFNSKDYQTNPERSYEPKGYFDLRMGVNKNEKITQIVGTDTPQMQLHFEMNRAWYAEPYFTIKVNEQMRALGEAGSTLYLFNYNPDTNELEMIGPMTPMANGNYRIQVKGIYKDYVILAGLPEGANYRITNRTNTLGGGTVSEIGQNYVDSGKAKTIDDGLNAANVTYQQISGDRTFDSLVEYETTTGNKISTQKNGKILPIAIGSITGLALLAGGSYLFYKKKKHLSE